VIVVVVALIGFVLVDGFILSPRRRTQDQRAARREWQRIMREVERLRDDNL
jgi:hypothetical protein